MPWLPRGPLDQIQRRLRVRIDHPKQRPRRGVGIAAVLLPVAQGGDGDAEPGGEFRLAEFGLGADRLDVRPGGDTALGFIAFRIGDGIGQPACDLVECFGSCPCLACSCR